MQSPYADIEYKQETRNRYGHQNMAVRLVWKKWDFATFDSFPSFSFHFRLLSVSCILKGSRSNGCHVDKSMLLQTSSQHMNGYRACCKYVHFQANGLWCGYTFLHGSRHNIILFLGVSHGRTLKSCITYNINKFYVFLKYYIYFILFVFTFFY